MTEKRDNGRPRLFDNEKDLQAKIDEYFDNLPVVAVGDKEVRCATITGLALSLGFCSRQSFYDYEKEDKFSYAIKRARLRVENEYEIDLKTKHSPTGSIFALKNMGWNDKAEEASEASTAQPVVVNIGVVDASEPEG